MIHAWKTLKKYADICFKIVINLHKLKETYHSNNNEKKELKCDHCDLKTKRKDSLLRHERCVHDMHVGVQFGDYFQSVLAESGIGYYSILLMIWHFCHKN